MPVNFDNTVWVSNSGFYPSLVELSAADASVVSVSPVLFSNNENYTNVSSNLTLQNGNFVEWASSNTNFLIISGSTATPILKSQKNTVYLTAELNGIKKIVPITIEIGTTTNHNTVRKGFVSIKSYENNKINIELTDNNLSHNTIVNVYSIQGCLLKTIDTKEKQIELVLSNYQSNIVILSISNDKSVFTTKLFLK
ncbi:hypothetical protein SDC9_56099 [bioreactor metagenome]|uniref:Secretion system C-terminal sorting domain-containing protein n=1 Tax=bioreactor metagenome TaxID=1076179 RepID=A0A644X0W3_9ZZZZ